MLFIPLHPEFGAKITDIDLSVPLSASTVDALLRAMDEHSLLCFRNQSLGEADHLRFTQYLGEPEPNHVKFGATGEIDYFGRIGNVIDEKTHKGNSDPHTRYQSGNNLWHSDSSFRKIPAKFSINFAIEVPEVGGETEFVSTRAVYRQLPQELCERIDPLLVLHDYVFSRSQVAPVDPNHAASLPPVEHRLVQRNPNNGCKNFYVGSHARSIVGWSGVEGRKLIDHLGELSAARHHVYQHQWNAGDVLIWDNRCLLHRGLGFDADRWRRLLRQTRVCGDADLQEG